MLYDEKKVKKVIKEFNEKCSYNGDINNLLPKFDKKEIVDGIGKIAVIYNGNVELTKALLLLAIRTHNSFSLITDSNFRENLQIVNMLNESLKNAEYEENSVELKRITRTAFLDIQRDFERVLIIGTKKDYTSLLSHLRIESVFYQYGEYNIFVDGNLDESNIKILKEIDEYAYENDQLINYIDISDLSVKKQAIDSILNSINLHGKNQTVSIFTTVQEHAYYFINALNCTSIKINSKPFGSIEFDENDFICRKHVEIK